MVWNLIYVVCMRVRGVWVCVCTHTLAHSHKHVYAHIEAKGQGRVAYLIPIHLTLRQGLSTEPGAQQYS